MERQRLLPLLAVILFIWVLWRYEAALALLGFFCNLIMPLFIGGCLAIYRQCSFGAYRTSLAKAVCTLFFRLASKIKRPVCLIFTLTLIIGIVLIRRAQNWPRSAPKL